MEKIINWMKANPVKTMGIPGALLGSIIAIMTFGDKIDIARGTFCEDERQEAMQEMRTEWREVTEAYLVKLYAERKVISNKFMETEHAGEIALIENQLEQIDKQIAHVLGVSE